MTVYNWIYALIPFALFCFLSVLLTRPRFSRKITYIIWSVVLAAVTLPHIVIFSLDKGATLLLSLMPITAYMPVVIAFFILSKRNAVSNILAVLMFSLSSVSVTLLYSFVSRLWAGNMTADLVSYGTIGVTLNLLTLLLSSVAIGFVAFRYLKSVFSKFTVLENKAWFVLIAVFLLLLFSRYQMEMLKVPTLIAFLLVLNIAVLAVIVVFIVARFKNLLLAEEQAKIEQQISAEREEYSVLKQSVEAGKRYRHDIKHHLFAIAALAVAGNNSEVCEYVQNVSGRMIELESRAYCKNNILNALLASFADRATKCDVLLTI